MLSSWFPDIVKDIGNDADYLDASGIKRYIEYMYNHLSLLDTMAGDCTCTMPENVCDRWRWPFLAKAVIVEYYAARIDRQVRKYL